MLLIIQAIFWRFINYSLLSHPMLTTRKLPGRLAQLAELAELDFGHIHICKRRRRHLPGIGNRRLKTTQLTSLRRVS